MSNREDITIGLRIAIRKKAINQIRELCRDNPWLVSDHAYTEGVEDEDDYKTPKLMKSWINYAAQELFGSHDYEVIDTMLELGFNINALNMPEGASVVEHAIDNCDFKMLQHVLSRGADPNLGRPIIAALNCNEKDLRMPFVQLLLDYGLNINNVFELYGDKSKRFTALDWTSQPEMVEYLRTHGAKTAAEICPESALSNSSQRGADWTYAHDVCIYFDENVGPVSGRSQIEIVPTGEPIDIHVIEARGDHQHMTLFTTGLSAQAMNTPAGQEEFALAELYIDLPGDWPFEQLNDPNHSWPGFWLRKIARYPRGNNTWLGGRLTIITNDDPPQPLAPGVQFTSWMVFADKSFERSDGRTVQLYRLVPLYTEERELEMREGIPALLQAFDRNSISFVVDIKRNNVGIARPVPK